MQLCLRLCHSRTSKWTWKMNHTCVTKSLQEQCMKVGISKKLLRIRSTISKTFYVQEIECFWYFYTRQNYFFCFLYFDNRIRKIIKKEWLMKIRISFLAIFYIVFVCLVCFSSLVCFDSNTMSKKCLGKQFYGAQLH